MNGPDWSVVVEKERTNQFSFQKTADKSDIVASNAVATPIDHSNTTSQASVKGTLSRADVDLLVPGRGRPESQFECGISAVRL